MANALSRLKLPAAQERRLRAQVQEVPALKVVYGVVSEGTDVRGFDEERFGPRPFEAHDRVKGDRLAARLLQILFIVRGRRGDNSGSRSAGARSSRFPSRHHRPRHPYRTRRRSLTKLETRRASRRPISSSRRRSCPSLVISRGRPAGKPELSFAHAPFILVTGQRRQSVVVGRPSEVEVDHPSRLVRGLEVEAVAVADVNLLRVENGTGARAGATAKAPGLRRPRRRPEFPSDVERRRRRLRRSRSCAPDEADVVACLSGDHENRFGNAPESSGGRQLRTEIPAAAYMSMAEFALCFGGRLVKRERTCPSGERTVRNSRSSTAARVEIPLHRFEFVVLSLR